MINHRSSTTKTLDEKDLFLFESTFGGTKDISNRLVFGVQIRNLKDVLESRVKEDSAIAKIRPKVFCVDGCAYEKDPIVIQKVQSFIRQTYGLPYPLNAVKFLVAFHHQVFHKFDKSLFGNDVCKKDYCFAKTYFCSQLVAELLKYLGILPMEAEPKSVLPMDFCQPDLDKIEHGGIPFICSSDSFRFLFPSVQN